MEAMFERCCGVDVHKKMLVACLRIGGKKKETRQYNTTTRALREFAQWLVDSRCEIVAMESTGVYWKPIYNLLENYEVKTIIVNARALKAVPGRKTDIKDAEWIAELLQHGLLRASFIPDRAQRDLRDLTRYRKSLVQDRTRCINRLEKILQGGNIKISSVASSITGKTSRSLLLALLGEGVSEENIGEYLYGTLKGKREELLEACEGVLTKVQKLLLRDIVDQIDDLTARIRKQDDRIEEEMAEYQEAIERLDEIPGIGVESAQVILAEIGLDMSRFPSAAHIASWAGLSPGNNESAGRRKSGKTVPGNPTLRTTLVQCAQSAVRVKNTFFKAQYERIKPRRGANRASVAVAHSMLIAIYHMLAEKVPFEDLGVDYYHRFHVERRIQYHLKQAERLGWQAPILATT